MSNENSDYGEPWTLEEITGDCERHILLRASNGRIISSEPSGDKDDPYLTRAKDCANACASITNPAEAIRLAREALQAEQAWRDATGETSDDLRIKATKLRKQALSHFQD